MNSTELTLIVVAKSPQPGRVKTRLCPPLTHEQAAELARAALKDTLKAVAGCDVRRVLLLDGPVGDWLPDGFEVIEQRGDGLGERIANGFRDACEGQPVLLIGMDTPQVTSAKLAAARDLLLRPDSDSLLGMAPDGGYWALGMRAADPRALDGVPMSVDETGAVQRQRLVELGHDVIELEELTDIDQIADAVALAAAHPMLGFSEVCRDLERSGAIDTSGNRK